MYKKIKFHKKVKNCFSKQFHDLKSMILCLGRSRFASFSGCVWVLGHFSRVWLSSIQRTVAHQAPLSMGFSRQEHWSGLPFPSPGDLPDPGIKPTSLRSPALAGRLLTTSATWEAPVSSIRGANASGTISHPSLLPREEEQPAARTHAARLQLQRRNVSVLPKCSFTPRAGSRLLMWVSGTVGSDSATRGAQNRHCYWLGLYYVVHV